MPQTPDQMRFRPDSFDVEGFLSDYWQQRPLLIRNPWRDWANPVTPDELAGLACEDGIEARLVRQTRSARKVEDGPFPTERFGKLPRQPYTLLVQAVDHYVPAVAALIAPFRFVPNWRVDDIMVSYATDGGGVGPHFDQYDVFLVQGLGRRRWQVGPACDASTPLLPDDNLRILPDFEVLEEWVLEPGDILYVPPRIAHNGVAIGDDCMTYSIGFRAPSRSELIAHWCDHLLAEADDDDRFQDATINPRANPGEISPEALARLQAMIAKTLGDSDAFARWFGEYTTTPKYPDMDWAPGTPITGATLKRRLREGSALSRNPASRFSFVRRAEGSVLLFVDGEAIACGDATASVAERLCASDHIAVEPGMRTPDALDLIGRLINQGSLAFAED